MYWQVDEEQGAHWPKVSISSFQALHAIQSFQSAKAELLGYTPASSDWC